MKTIFLHFSLLLLLCMSNNIFAQDANIQISPYLGVAGSHGSDRLQTPSFGVIGEYFLDETFSLGLIAAYGTAEAKTNFDQNADPTTSGFNVGALINYYWTDSETFNFYTGGSIGYDGYSGPYIDGGIYFEIHAGGRYQLSEKIGLFSELGYGLSLLKVGVSFKI